MDRSVSPQNAEDAKRLRQLFWLIFFLGWSSLVAITASFISAIASLPTSLALRLALAFWGFYALAAPLVFRLARRFPLNRKSWRRNLWIHLAGTLAFVVVCEGGFAGMIHLFDPDDPEPVFANGSGIPALREGSASAQQPTASADDFNGGLPDSPLKLIAFKAQFGVPFYWVLVGIAHSLATMVALREREQKAAQLAAHLAEAQLTGLRTQLHPHFLFNTLNSIAALIPQNAVQATEMVMNLSDLLRMTLREPLGGQIRLSEELELLRYYVDIQKLRFGERLEFDAGASDEAMDVFVPPLLLQPLVENAIRHGVETSDETERISVKGFIIDQNLHLEVDNTSKSSADHGRQGAGSTGVGLANTRARLQVQYGDLHFFQAGPREQDGFRVCIRIPVRLEGAPGATATHYEN